MSKPALPRYRILANALRAEITSGRLKPGDQLKTELELCEIHNISRHTAREAMRLLTDDKLIERKRGSGTVVAQISAPTFEQPIGDFEAILQYARNAHFVLTSSAPADQEALDRTGLTGKYQQYIGLRTVDGKPPIAITAIYIPKKLAPTDDIIHGLETSVSEWIEQTHGVAVARVVQRMEAVALDASQAKRLGVNTGFPALRTIRRYRDASERIILLSESLHPAGRFAYEMRLDRSR
ncbi:GntR family transcriptional regulator [Hyphomonas sp.]|uniref:GntR family transcriptional regulator n=1 Tax=Hyphomonas sp. TaxID=87 RepID=UPI001D8E6B38|nr:GntR family transcriptional regulator [Hyphomonas sp.]